MRLFISINLPGEIEGHFRELQQEFAKFGKMNLAAGFHLTLKFLGDVEDDKEVVEALSQIKFGAFDLEFDRVGVFGRRDQPRVLWVSFEKSEALNELQKQVEAACVRLGFEPEEREFRPHMTLARVKGISDLDGFYRAIEETVLEEKKIEVCEFCLMESFLGSEGAKYAERGVFGGDFGEKFNL